MDFVRRLAQSSPKFAKLMESIENEENAGKIPADLEERLQKIEKELKNTVEVPVYKFVEHIIPFENVSGDDMDFSNYVYTTYSDELWNTSEHVIAISSVFGLNSSPSEIMTHDDIFTTVNADHDNKWFIKLGVPISMLETDDPEAPEGYLADGKFVVVVAYKDTVNVVAGKGAMITNVEIEEV